MAECFELKIKLLYLDVHKMEVLPENLINKAYKYKHEMLYSNVMKQLKPYRINVVFQLNQEIWIHV